MKIAFALASLVSTLAVVACSGNPDNVGGASAADTTAEACQTATDCTGLLPRNTETCADGTTQGASFTCAANLCAVDFCSAHGGAADAPVNCATVQFQSCDQPTDCAGALPDGWSWGCTVDTPLATCNFAEPVCIAAADIPSSNGGADGGDGAVDGGSGGLDCSKAQFQSCESPADCTGAIGTGWTWSCTVDSPLAACNFAEPVCVKTH